MTLTPGMVRARERVGQHDDVVEVTVDHALSHAQYRIPLPHGRSLEISGDQVRRIARGLGDHADAPPRESQAPPLVRAIAALPPDQRAEALAVVLLRFGQKHDIETISQIRGLTAWQVWQLEEAFRDALAEAEAESRRVRAELAEQLEGSDTARVMASDLRANALAHGEPVDLGRKHEDSLRTVPR